MLTIEQTKAIYSDKKAPQLPIAILNEKGKAKLINWLDRVGAGYNDIAEWVKDAEMDVNASGANEDTDFVRSVQMSHFDTVSGHTELLDLTFEDYDWTI